MTTLRKIFFFIAIKTPIAAILLIISVFSSLSHIIFRCETDVYEKHEASVLRKNGTVLFVADLSPEEIERVSAGSKAIWYFSDTGKRYAGIIKELSKENNVVLIQNTSAYHSSDFEDEDKVFVEIIVGKAKIFHKLLLRESEG